MRTATIFVKPCVHVKAIKRLFVHIFMALLKSWSQTLKHSQPRSCLPSGGERSCCISFHTLSPPTHNHHCAVSFSSVGRPSRATWRVSHHRGNYVKLFFFLPNNMFSTRFISTASDFSMVFDPPLPPCDPWTSASSSQPLLDSANDFSFFGRREEAWFSARRHWISMLFAHVDCNWWVTGCCTCDQIMARKTLMEAGIWVVPFGQTVIMGLRSGLSHLLTTVLWRFQPDHPLITAAL